MGKLEHNHSINHFSHETCSNLPTTLKHQSDQSHDLVLLSSPAYPEGVFKCNACGSNGNGFSYHCPDCQLDLHVECASMPMTMGHAAHGHTLGLCFVPPYDDNRFKCDICKQPGSNWLYRCNPCEFDAHMDCATGRASSRALLPKSTSLPSYKTPRPVKIYYSTPPIQIGTPQVLTKTTSLPHHNTQFYQQQPPPPQPVQPYYYQAGPATGVPQYVQPRPGQSPLLNQLAGHAVEGFVGSVTQEIMESVFEGMIS